MMIKPDFDSACQYVFHRLAQELPATAYYHNLRHTQKDVLPATTRLATCMGIAGEPLLLLQTAALYHDVGYIAQPFDNEGIAVQVARETLPTFGYSLGQIQGISGLIIATSPTHQPQNLLQEIMQDADLDSLGRDDFFMLGHCLRLEWTTCNRPTTLREWDEIQLVFLRNHRYHTDATRKLRESGKQKNIRELEKLLDTASDFARPLQYS